MPITFVQQQSRTGPAAPGKRGTQKGSPMLTYEEVTSLPCECADCAADADTLAWERDVYSADPTGGQPSAY